MNETLQRFRALTLERTGLALRESDLSQAQSALHARCKALRVNGDGYLQLLSEKTPSAEREWARLMPHLTNGESYFFRDMGQIALLRDQLLPELISRATARPMGARTLHLWSAGCSSGEEAYSLAMLLDGLLPQRIRDGWRINILGTDINEQAVERARRGEYRPWSLRALDPGLRVRYFRETSVGWQIASHLRDMVTFAVGNLRADTFPSPGGPHAMDAILCRNVLIYFDRAAVDEVVRKFAATLNPGGYLLTGHAELHPQDLGCLRPRLLTGSVVYVRPVESASTTSDTAASHDRRLKSGLTLPVTSSTPRPTSPTHLPPVVAPRPALNPLSALRQPSAARSSAPLPAPLSSLPLVAPREDTATLLREAQTHADAGRYDAAVAACERAIKQNAFGAAPYLLLARIAEEREDADRAIGLLKKAIYLAPRCTVAYLELGALYAGRGEAMRARQMRRIALEQLETGDHLDAAFRNFASHNISNAENAGDLPPFEIAESERQALIEQLHRLLEEPSLGAESQKSDAFHQAQRGI